MKLVRIVFVGLICGVISTVRAEIASVQWVQSTINSIGTPTASDVGAVAATQATLGGILTTNATTGAVEVSSTIAESKVANLTTDLAGKQSASSAAYQMGGANGTWTTMSQAQQDALNSGITSSIVTKIGTGTIAVGDGNGDLLTDLTSAINQVNNELGNRVMAEDLDAVSAALSDEGVFDADNTVEDAIDAKQDKLGGSGNDGKAVIASGTAGSVTYRAIDTTSGGTASSTDLITSGAVNAGLAGKVTANAAITGATKTKITYDSKGLVTSGADLEAADIPDLATSKVTTLTGYSKGSDATALAATDTLNAALSKLENQIDGKQASGSYVPTTTTVNGNALSSNVTLDGADISLTGYTKPNATSAVAASDTVNTAIGKLEAGILPVGTTSGTVSAGDDTRFDSVSTTQPAGTPPTGRVWVWFN